MQTSPTFGSFTETILKTGEVIRKELAGNYFYCIESTGLFQMKLDDGRWFEFDQSFAFPYKDGFTSVSFKAANGAQADNLIKFYVTTGAIVAHLNTIRNPVNYQAFQHLVAPTLAKSFAPAVLEAGESVNLYGTGGTGAGKAGEAYSYRKSVIITNSDAGSDLEVYLGDGVTRCGTVFKAQGWHVETSADLIVKNETGAPINCRILELFYAA
jgi:hypothetical protein